MAEDYCNPGTRFAEALTRLDNENARDPTKIMVNGLPRARELAYAEWLTEWVLRLDPNASEALLLAARSQHIRRWEVPRASQPAGRAGYLRWRSEMKKFHADLTWEILAACGYPAETIHRVRELNLKLNPAGDPECQLLEDALCLVTLRHQLDELLSKVGDQKMIPILQKTWKKMSPKGQAEARNIILSPALEALLSEALVPGTGTDAR